MSGRTNVRRSLRSSEWCTTTRDCRTSGGIYRGGLVLARMLIRREGTGRPASFVTERDEDVGELRLGE